MKQRCLILLTFFSTLISCKTVVEKDVIPDFWDLSVIDSVLVMEDKFFLNSQTQVKLIGDSLLAVSSYRSPMVAIITTKGEQVGKIASGDFPIGSFSPSSFDVSEYPIIHILDKKSESVLVFNAKRQEFIKKIKLQLPDDKVIRFMGAKFKKLPDGFLVEMVSSIYDSYHPDFYRASGDQIYFFGNEGQIKNSIVDYPKEYKAVVGSMSPVTYLTMGDFGNDIALSFPHSKKVNFYSTNGEMIDSVALPESRFFDYNLHGADQILDFSEIFASGEQNKVHVPTNHYFNSIHGNREQVIVETWMNNKKTGEEYATYSHLLIFNKEAKKWSETSNPRNILDIGMLAGVVNDTLYFYEGSLMKSDEKYIKRAVLRPIED
ncbi:hypothetical protein [Algoriphagus sp.]|jgi:hypothetical protein|uniref:hypothetical protein n=1 Tax=Algoriphagus sp. TaxID=1872435 RepID=UPI00271D7B24|nr:hypothetical protein [Algoriphagus sp.]MDO8967388.1 hypothetical protein [Algoriphagus sp.]MDP3200670.1 hypothetical protein [Algoriphagus sp.]